MAWAPKCGQYATSCAGAENGSGGVLMLVFEGSTCGLRHLDVSWLVSALYCVSTLFLYTDTAAVSAQHVAGVADDHDG